MRRVLETFKWESSWWAGQTERLVEADNGRGTLSEELREGLAAYAAEHSAMFTDMGRLFERVWADVRTDASTVLSRKSVLDEAVDTLQ